MRKIVYTIFVLLTFSAAGMCSDGIGQGVSPSRNITLNSQPAEIGKKIVNNIVNRRFGWRYQKACTYYGSLIFADATHDEEILRQLQKAYEPWLEGRKKPHKGHVDYNVFGIWPFEIYRQTKDERYLSIPKDLADLEFQELQEDGLSYLTRFWVDDMYMVGSLQVQAYKSLKEEVYLDRAAKTLKVYCEKLQRPNGLFYHRDDAPYYWGRGNGWAAAAMTEVLLVLPEDHEYYNDILNAYRKMMAALMEMQADDGMWHQLLDDHESFAESSCTGMFTYALASGLDRGWLPWDQYIGDVVRGWEALAGYVNEGGEAMDVCVGTNAKPKKRHYLTRPRSTGNYHGQAAVLWAATAMERLRLKLM